ncbi:MAG: hypothetical protein JSS36_10250, partial [Proteobacteria bacterium]|nr:hypothetical protein [Pseudomonadota bacterium]
MTTSHSHTSHPRVSGRKAEGVVTRKAEQVGFNGWLAVKITNAVGTMWCA